MFVHLVLDGVADGPLGVGVEVLATAASLVPAGAPRAALRQRVCSLDGRDVRSGTGRLVVVDGAPPRRWTRGDVLLVPGLSAVATEPALEARLRRDDTALTRLLKRAHASGATVAASCVSTFLLARAGLLDFRPATTTWWLAGAFARHFPDVRLTSDQMVVDAGVNVLTAGAALAHTDLVLAVLRRHAGPSLARLVTNYLVLDERPSQARYLVLEQLRTADPAIEAIERFVNARLTRPPTLPEVGKAVGLSPRTLVRRVHAALGMTPHDFLQRLRVNRAAHLLDTTRQSVEQVAEAVGYTSAASFRRAFRVVTGVLPTAHRTRAS